ncbi:hypothetical protein IG631_23340 [Alternaria alternata]|nr:hypothetical protein IG631_23340 [Alternaria alternata]
MTWTDLSFEQVSQISRYIRVTGAGEPRYCGVNAVSNAPIKTCSKGSPCQGLILSLNCSSGAKYRVRQQDKHYSCPVTVLIQDPCLIKACYGGAILAN